MSIFELNSEHLIKLMELAQFTIPEDKYIIVGLRGCSPLFFEDQSEKPTHMLELQPIDNLHMRCTILLWQPKTGVFSVYPGSTVPGKKGISAQFNAGKDSKVANQLVTCFLSEAKSDAFSMDRRYRKRIHGGSVSHWALGNDNKQPVQRSFDNLFFDGGDNLLDQTVNDNIHCSNNSDPNNAGVGSYGCQTIAGNAKHGNDPSKQSSDKTGGSWKKFSNRVYSAEQKHFSYALFYGYEARKTAIAGNTRRPTIRFGSTGPLVKRVQTALNDMGYPCGTADGLAGFDTMNQVCAFQKDQFSVSGVDMIVGVGTSVALGISDWPEAEELIEDIQITFENGILTQGISKNTKTKRSNVPIKLTGSRAVLDTRHQPLNGWKIIEDIDGNGNRVWFLEAEGIPPSFKIGREQFYGDHSQIDCIGISRHHAHSPQIPFRPEEWETDFGLWSYALDGLIRAESDRNFGVCNGYDVAGFTAFCSQLAAHTGDDLLLGLESVVRNLPDEASDYFPELQIINDKLHFAYDGQLIDFYEQVTPYDGEFSKDYYYGHLMGFLNPNRKKINTSEIHAAARFAAWAHLSENFRREQIRASIENAKSSIDLIHIKMRKSQPIREAYPEGVNNLRADWLAALLHIPHISPSRALSAAKLLLEDDPLKAAISYQITGHEGRSEKIRASISDYGSKLSKAKFDYNKQEFI